MSSTVTHDCLTQLRPGRIAQSILEFIRPLNEHKKASVNKILLCSFTISFETYRQQKVFYSITLLVQTDFKRFDLNRTLDICVLNRATKNGNNHALSQKYR